MMITVVTMAKNEENLIESFVRHALSFADNIVIYDHNSTDGTGAILHELKKEFGERILLWQEEEITLKIINQEVYNRMTRYAFQTLSSDMVLPLDADEFPIRTEKRNVREYLQQLDSTKCYRVHFMPFAIPDEWRTDVFAPLLFTKRKKLNANTDFKMILLKEPYERFRIYLGLGNHMIGYECDGDMEIQIEDIFPELFYAHFPFRSKEHLESKIVLRQLALEMRTDVTADTAFQYTKGFQQIMEGISLSDEETAWYCLNNMCKGVDQFETLEEIQASVECVDPSELFVDQKLKYTEQFSQQKSGYRILLEFSERLAKQYSEECRKLMSLDEQRVQLENQKDQLENQYSDECQKVETLNEQLVNRNQQIAALEMQTQAQANDLEKMMKECEELKTIIHEKNLCLQHYEQEGKRKDELIDTYANSTSWKMTEPFRRFTSWLHKKR